MNKCIQCKNLGLVGYRDGNVLEYCKFGVINLKNVNDCNMFEQIQDYKYKPKAEAKAVGNKGKYPRSRKGCFKVIKSARQAFESKGG